MRLFLLLLLFFCIGFFVHAQFFPDLFPEQIITNAKKTMGVEEKKQQKKGSETNLFDQSTKEILYKNGSFKPSRIITKTGNRVVIQNDDETELMWLNSENQNLTTSRGYGNSEQFVVIFHEKGTFTTINKLHPQGKLVIEVQ